MVSAGVPPGCRGAAPPCAVSSARASSGSAAGRPPRILPCCGCCRCCPEPRSAPLRSASGSVKAPKCRRRRPPFIRSRARRERSPRAWRLLTGPLPAPPVPAGGAEAVPAPGAALGGGGAVLSLGYLRNTGASHRFPLRSPGVGAEGGPGHHGAALPAALGHRELLGGREQPLRGPGSRRRTRSPPTCGTASARLHLGQRVSLPLTEQNRKSRAKSLF